MQMITKLVSDKEKLPPTRPKNQRISWYYCYSCGAQVTHPSDKCTSKLKLASYKDEETFKDTMGGSTRKCKIPDDLRFLVKGITDGYGMLS